MLRDRDGFALDESDPEKCIDNDPLRLELQRVEAFDRHPADRFEDIERFQLRPPNRRFLELSDQIVHDVGNIFRRDPFAVLALLLLPLCIIPSPALPVALLLGAGLGVGSLFCTWSEREHVARHGYDSNYQPRKLAQVESDLNWAIVGVLLGFAGPLMQGLSSGARSVAAVSRATTDLSKFIAAVENVPAPMRLILRRMKGPILARMISLGARNPDSAVLARVFSKAVHESVEPGHLFLLDSVRLSFVFTDNYLGFRLPTLQRLYDRYLKKFAANVKRKQSGKDLSTARLELEPLEWILTGDKRALKFAAMEQLVGSDWKRIVTRHRQFVPLREDVLKIYREFPRNLTYAAAKRFRRRATPADLKMISIDSKKGPELLSLQRRANRSALSGMLQLEHPFERRFVNMLAGGEKDAAKLLDYEREARVILVPTNRGVARRIPDFDGYIHSEKTNTLDWLIPTGSEHLYSLQQIRDAHVFTIASVGGRGSQTQAAIKLIDDAVASIAQKLRMTVEYSDPFASGFSSRFTRDAWNYVIPLKPVSEVRFNRRFLFQNFLIDLPENP
jgi:hypothetical protein